MQRILYSLLIWFAVYTIHILTSYSLEQIIGNHGYIRNFFGQWFYGLFYISWLHWIVSYSYLWILKQGDSRLEAYAKSCSIVAFGYLIGNVKNIRYGEWGDFLTLFHLFSLIPIIPILAELGLWIKKRMASKTA